MQSADLRLRIHHRGRRAILHVLAREDHANLLGENLDLLVIGLDRLDHRQLQRIGQADLAVHVAAEPTLQRQVTLRREVRLDIVQLHHRRESLRNVGDIGYHGALGREDRFFRRIDVVHTELLHEPFLFLEGVIARTGNGAGMTAGAGQLGLPAADDAGDHRFIENQIMLVISARLDIHHGRLAALIVMQRMGELAGSEMDIDILARGDGGGRAPAGRQQIGGDSGGEVARVGEDGNRTLHQRLLRRIAAEGAADADMLVCIAKAEAVGAEDVHLLHLAISADDSGVAERHLLGQDHHLVDVGVDTYRLDDGILDARRRHIDDGHVKFVAGFQRLGDIVVDRNIAGLGLHHRTRTARHGAADDISARVLVADRCYCPALAAEDVKNTYPILLGGQFSQRIDSNIMMFEYVHTFVCPGIRCNCHITPQSYIFFFIR